MGWAAPPSLSSAPSMGGPWVLTLCGPCADLREAPQPVSSGAEHPIVQCSLLSGSPQTGGWEAGRGHPEEGPPKGEAVEAQSAPATLPCPAPAWHGWGALGSDCWTKEDAESSRGLRGTVTQRTAGSGGRVAVSDLRDGTRLVDLGACSVPSREHSAGLCVPLGTAQSSQRACPRVALFRSSDDPGGTHLCPCPAI